jgi:hypothetical protein
MIKSQILNKIFFYIKSLNFIKVKIKKIFFYKKIKKKYKKKQFIY